jgi:hypothetical protein
MQKMAHVNANGMQGYAYNLAVIVDTSFAMCYAVNEGQKVSMELID